MKTRFLIVIVSILVASCSLLPAGGTVDPDTTALPDIGNLPSEIVNDVPETVELPDLGIAPELSNQVWINTDQPLRLADLRGKVVLLEMWTFG